MTNRVDTAVNSMQPTMTDPPGDSVLAQPGPGQLSNRDDAMLVSRNSRDGNVRTVDFLSHTATKSTVAPVLPLEL
jgi:hypothetical protein